MAQRPQILIVDDEQSVALALSMALEDEDWDVHVSHTATDAQALIAEHSFDVLILDKNLPDMDGVTLLGEVRKSDQSVRAIMLTGYATVDSAMVASSQGIDFYLEKPLHDVGALPALVGSCLAAKALADEELPFLEPQEARPLSDTIKVALVAESDERKAALASLAKIPIVRVIASTTSLSEALSSDDIDLLLWTGDLETSKALGTREQIGNVAFAVLLESPTLKLVQAWTEFGASAVLDRNAGSDEFTEKLGRVVSRVANTVIRIDHD